MSNDNKLLGGLALTALMFATSKLARRSAAHTWTLVSSRPPPSDLSNRQVNMTEAVTWALVSGAAVGVARLLVRRGIVYDGLPTDERSARKRVQ